MKIGVNGVEGGVKGAPGVVIYDQAVSGEVVRFDLDAQAETIWADVWQMAEVFGVDRTVILRHIRNIYMVGELDEAATCAISAQVREEGGRKVKRQVKRYNLDMMISVGYRVNSAKATKFRIWASKVLKQYIVNGVAINSTRLAELPAEKLRGLEGALRVVRRLVLGNDLSAGEANGVLEVIGKYAASFETLREYERGRVVRLSRNFAQKRKMGEAEVMRMVDELRASEGESEMFGKLRSPELFERIMEIWRGDLATVRDLEGGGLPGGDNNVPERAAQILYMVTKEQPFYDGNKRIAALFFVVFLTFNDYNLAENGETKISDRALVALTLLMAESEESERELLVELVCKLMG